MNILIVGDSWSKPDGYTDPNLLPDFPEEKLSIEYYLIKKGHTVYNRGEGGRSNLNSLRLAHYFLKVAPHINLTIDLVIFFNTDLSRDRLIIFPDHDYPHSLQELTLSLYNENLKWFDKIRKHYSGKWVIIGGNAPVVDVKDFTWADMLVEDWRSEILGYKLPTSQWLYDYPFLEKNIKILGVDDVAKEVENIELIWDTVKSRVDLFPDKSHPSFDCHEQLAERILQYFDKDKL